jgi:hypothetical protein
MWARKKDKFSLLINTRTHTTATEEKKRTNKCVMREAKKKRKK